MLAYKVTFVSQLLRGKLPPLIVQTSSVTYSASLTTPAVTTWVSTYGSGLYNVGDVHDATTPGMGYISTMGNQPSGILQNI